MSGLALLTALWVLTPEATQEPERRVHLQIDSEALLDEQIADAAADTTFFVRTDGTKALGEAHGVQVVEGEAEAAPTIVVRLWWVSYAQSIYGVRIETVRPGEPPRLVERFPCACADSELSAAVVARLPAALAQLEAPEPVPTPTPVQPAAMLPTATPTPSVMTTSPARRADGSLRRPLGRLGWSGIGVAGVGAGALVAGGIVYAQGRRFEQPSGQLERREGRDFEPPGIALMATGSLALVTGAVLLVVDRTRDRRAVSALVLPSPGGLVITGRFGGGRWR